MTLATLRLELLVSGWPHPSGQATADPGDHGSSCGTESFNVSVAGEDRDRDPARLVVAAVARSRREERELRRPGRRRRRRLPPRRAARRRDRRSLIGIPGGPSPETRGPTCLRAGLTKRINLATIPCLPRLGGGTGRTSTSRPTSHALSPQPSHRRGDPRGRLLGDPVRGRRPSRPGGHRAPRRGLGRPPQRDHLRLDHGDRGRAEARDAWPATRGGLPPGARRHAAPDPVHPGPDPSSATTASRNRSRSHA